MQSPRAVEREDGAQDDTRGSDGGETPGVILHVIDQIHAEQAGDEGAGGEAEGVDGDPGLEEHDLVALDGEAGAEGVFLLAEDVDGPARGLGQRVRRLVVRLQHVLGLLVVADVVGPPAQAVGQVHGREVFVRVEHLADRLPHQPCFRFDLGEPSRVLEDTVQLDGREARFQIQLLRAFDGRLARREELFTERREHRHQRRLHCAKLVRQRWHVRGFVHTRQPLLEVMIQLPGRRPRDPT